MSAVLDPTHCWGERPTYVRVDGNLYREVKIPCCICCLVDGYEDDYVARRPCLSHNPERVAAMRAKSEEGAR